jgi:hypothetical protein
VAAHVDRWLERSLICHVDGMLVDVVTIFVEVIEVSLDAKDLRLRVVQKIAPFEVSQNGVSLVGHDHQCCFCGSRVTRRKVQPIWPFSPHSVAMVGSLGVYNVLIRYLYYRRLHTVGFDANTRHRLHW